MSVSLFAQEEINKWALPRISVAHIRVKPGHSSELSSQVVMGTPIKILEKVGDWYHIETPEGYQGYTIGKDIKTDL